MVAEKQEFASLYSLGMLTGTDLARFEAWLSAGDPEAVAALESAQESVVAMAEATATPAPPALKERLMKRLQRPDTAASLPSGLRAMVRQDEGQWRPLPYPGVESKTLYLDRASGTHAVLVRMAAGSEYPAHHHAEDEHLIVLEGDLIFQGYELQAGDYVLAAGDSVHSVSTSRGGCTLFAIRNSRDTLLQSKGAIDGHPHTGDRA